MWEVSFMPFALSAVAPLGSVLGGSSPLTPPVGGISPLSAQLDIIAKAPAETGQTAALPPPDVVYEPGAAGQDALLTYSPPAPQDTREADPAPTQDEPVLTVIADEDAPAGDRAAAPADNAVDDDLAAADAALSVAVAASSGVRTQIVPEPIVEQEMARSPVSVQVARAVQALQVSQPTPAGLPGDPAPAPAADPHAQSQLMAQAVYSLIADAYVQNRAVTDLIKFA